VSVLCYLLAAGKVVFFCVGFFNSFLGKALTEKKNALRSEYGKLKQQAREYGIIKKNVDSILNPGTERARGKERNAEL
jgi:hypothetical protein